MRQKAPLRKQELRDAEQALHFCGVSFYDEASPEERMRRGRERLGAILRNAEARTRFESAATDNLLLTWTFDTRLAGLVVAIANCVSGNNLFDRAICSRLPQLGRSAYFGYDPIFGERVDALVGEPRFPPVVLDTGLRSKPVIKIADFGCAPKRGGSGTIRLLHSVLSTLFPEKTFEFAGYDVQFMSQYPVFDEAGLLVGWEQGYIFDSSGMAALDGDVYYNANNPRFNIVPQREGAGYRNTFDASHQRYDIIINSMFYSVFEMNGAPQKSLETMTDNMLDLRTQEGVLFLNTCDDCFKVFPSPSRTPNPQIIPFISSLHNIEMKVQELLSGGSYCRGALVTGRRPKVEEEVRVRSALYLAHRMATSELTFLDRLFAAYEIVNAGRGLDAALQRLLDPHLRLSEESKRLARARVYSIKQHTA